MLFLCLYIVHVLITMIQNSTYILPIILTAVLYRWAFKLFLSFYYFEIPIVMDADPCESFHNCEM